MSRTAELTRRTYPISTSYPHAITGHRQRASLALLLIAAVFCMLYAPLSARADWYLFLVLTQSGVPSRISSTALP